MVKPSDGWMAILAQLVVEGVTFHMGPRCAWPDCGKIVIGAMTMTYNLRDRRVMTAHAITPPSGATD